MGSRRTNTGSRRTRTKKTMDIPKDVMFEILSKLPVEYLLRLRWLCKYWFKVITDPDFVKMHFNNVHATTNPLVMKPTIRYGPRIIQFCSLNSLNDAMSRPVNIKAPFQFTSSPNVIPRILGSCNGLLCIHCYRSSTRYSEIYIWNPCTKQYKLIWRFNLGKKFTSSICYGFGYDCSTDDYKVIRNVCCSLKGNDIDIYTLGTSSSKTISNNRFFLYGSDNGVFINGDLYWKANLTGGSGRFDLIVAFDVGKEEYRQITSMPFINHDNYYSHSIVHLRNFDGILCVLQVTDNYNSMEVWVMNRNMNNQLKTEYSWDLLYTISAPRWSNKFFGWLKPLRFCRNGEIAMVMRGSDLVFYDPKSKQIRYLRTVGGTDVIETYIESLVPVKGGSYIDGPVPSIATIHGPPSIGTGKRKREVKRPLRFQDEY